MGAENSTPVDESVPPITLYGRTIEAVADYVKKNDVKRVVVMTGAGISTSAGIPDFRSPKTGLYANLARLNLPYAEAVFDISFFKTNPHPFYELAHELYPGRYRPTISHSFISLLNKKGMLLKHFTQNIDCLDREAGVPAEKIVEAHGSFATQRCIRCKTEYPDDDMKEAVATKEVPHCVDDMCDGLVKPDIVFFGEALPESFFMARGLPASCDLAIIMGTSLTVQPFASLPMLVGEGTPRILINMERVGGLGSRPDDVCILGDCDDGVRKLADALGWRDELDEMWEASHPPKPEKQEAVSEKRRDKQTELEDRIAEVTAGVESALKLSEDHKQQFEEDFASRKDTGTLPVPGSKPDSLSKDAGKEVDDVKAKDEKPELASLSHVFPHLDPKASSKPSL